MISLKRWPKVSELREKLNRKAKAEKTYRFYLLYDKVFRKDFLEAAYAQCRNNGGAPGIDSKTFADIEEDGRERYLAELEEELKDRRYEPQPVRRVLIPKPGQPGKYRPLGIPTIRDRIVQQAVKLLLEPIFEADFTDNAYGYRAGMSAHDAIEDVATNLRSGYTEVVDADLSKYFDTIPHRELMCSVERRIADPKVLWLIRRWLKVPVHETNKNGKIVITGGKHTKQGTPQGGVISPLLANIYFRRFLVAWTKFGYDRKFTSRIVNYADDFVILTRRRAQPALQAAKKILESIGLTLNTTKTRTCEVWKESFTFLGYTFGVQYSWGGRRYLGKTPAEKGVEKYRETLRKLTASDQTSKAPQTVAGNLNCVTRGYWNYFSLGTTVFLRHDLDEYLRERMTIWAKRKYKRPRKRKGLKRSPAKVVWQRVEAVRAMLVYGRDIPRAHHSREALARGASAACLA